MSILKKGEVLETTSGAPVELIDLIQEGGQASVWKVKEIGTSGRTLAAKLIFGRESERKTRAFTKLIDDIENEVAILGDLQHRFIGNYLYSIQHAPDDRDCLVLGYVMQFAPIGTLRDMLKDKGFKPREILKESEKSTVVRRLAQAVATVHNRGIVHSDIKAENVLIQIEDGQVTPLLIDFGGSFHVHQAWRGMRTERYSAPELEDGAAATIQSDVYALGVLVSEILSGTRLWQPTPDTLDRLTISRDNSITYLGLVKRMLLSDPSKRPDPNTISKAFLTKESEHTLSSGSADMELSFPLGKFQWHPSLHLSYQAVKVFSFLKSSNPTSDARLLRKVMDRKKFFGASIHRVFGANDFYVEIWLPEERINGFSEAIAQFQTEQPHHHYDVSQEIYDIVKLPKGKVPSVEIEDLFGQIAERFERGDEPNSIDRFVIRENDPELDDTRYLLSMTPRTKVNTVQIEIITDLIVEYLSDCRHITASQKSITKVFGSSSDSKILISVPVKTNRKYTDLMLGVSNFLKKKMLVAGDFVFDYSTYIDMDGNGFYDGSECFFRDDGLIPTKLLEDYPHGG